MVKNADFTDLAVLAELALLLWPHHSRDELEEEFRGIMTAGDSRFFLKLEDGRAVGFAQCQLRHDYVEGTESSPVGYLEGIFVREAFRRRGFARELLAACESWAVAQGCQEFASDCELDNLESFRFHLALGFLEANRVICFTKNLKENEK